MVIFIFTKHYGGSPEFLEFFRHKSWCHILVSSSLKHSPRHQNLGSSQFVTDIWPFLVFGANDGGHFEFLGFYRHM